MSFAGRHRFLGVEFLPAFFLYTVLNLKQTAMPFGCLYVLPGIVAPFSFWRAAAVTQVLVLS